MYRMLCLAAFAAMVPNVASAGDPPVEDEFEIEIGEELRQPPQDVESEINEVPVQPKKRPAVVKPKPQPEPAPVTVPEHEHKWPPHKHEIGDLPDNLLTEEEGDDRYAPIDHEHDLFDSVVIAAGAGGGGMFAPGLGLTGDDVEFSGTATGIGRIRVGATQPGIGLELQGAYDQGVYADNGFNTHALFVGAPTRWLRLGAGVGGQGHRVGVEDGTHQGAFWGLSLAAQAEFGTPMDDDHPWGVSLRPFVQITPRGVGLNALTNKGFDFTGATLGATVDASRFLANHR